MKKPLLPLLAVFVTGVALVGAQRGAATRQPGNAANPGAAAAINVLARETGVGAKYGTRDPVSCQSRKLPAKGAPSPELAALYFKCGRERVSHDSSNSLDLFENVKVEIGKGRPYNASDSSLTDIDPSLPVYPIRGSFDVYACADPEHMSKPSTATNCRVNQNVHGNGVCYQTTFSDWACIMGYDVDFRTTKRGVPGPK